MAQIQKVPNAIAQRKALFALINRFKRFGRDMTFAQAASRIKTKGKASIELFIKRFGPEATFEEALKKMTARGWPNVTYFVRTGDQVPCVRVIPVGDSSTPLKFHAVDDHGNSHNWKYYPFAGDDIVHPFTGLWGRVRIFRSGHLVKELDVPVQPVASITKLIEVSTPVPTPSWVPEPDFKVGPVVSNGSLYVLPITRLTPVVPKSDLLTGNNFRGHLAGTQPPEYPLSFCVDQGRTVVLPIEGVREGGQIGVWLEGKLIPPWLKIPPLSGFSYDFRWNDSTLWAYITNKGPSMIAAKQLVTNCESSDKPLFDRLMLTSGQHQPMVIPNVEPGEYVTICDENGILFAFVVPNVSLRLAQPTCL